VKFFPPVVTGTVITTIGLSLMPVAAGWAMGGDASAADYGSIRNILITVATLAVVLILSRIPVAMVSRLSILMAIVICTIGCRVRNTFTPRSARAVVLVLIRIPVAMVSRPSILLAIVIGTIGCLIFGWADFSLVLDRGSFASPEPFAVRMPTFSAAAIISMFI